MNQKKRKRLLSFLVTMAMVISLLQGMSLTAYADRAHTHDGVTFVEWTDALAKEQNGSSSTASNSLPKQAGNYYLANDVTLNSGESWTVPAGTTNLCLNNYGIIQKEGYYKNDVIRINRNVTLNLYDTDRAKRRHTYSTTPYGLARVGGSGKTFTGGYITGGTGFACGGVFNYGGTFNMYDGTIIGNSTGNNGGGVNNYGGTFNMYGGAIIGNYGCDSSEFAPGGAGVYNNGTFNMYGGEISGNTCTHDGGGVYNDEGGTFTMSGTAKITNNKAGASGGYGGGGVYNKGTFIMESGVISGNTASYYCGGVQSTGTFKITGNSTITGNKGRTSDNVDGTVTRVSPADPTTKGSAGARMHPESTEYRRAQQRRKELSERLKRLFD